MSEVRRISDDAFDFVCNHQRDGEDWKDALDRLLGIEDDIEYITKSEAEELIDTKIEEARKSY